MLLSNSDFSLTMGLVNSICQGPTRNSLISLFVMFFHCLLIIPWARGLLFGSPKFSCESAKISFAFAGCRIVTTHSICRLAFDPGGRKA